MHYGVKHLKVLAEDDKVRVLKYAPRKGVKTPLHSHPASVVYVLKVGRLKYSMPDGSTKIAELKTGEMLLRRPITHADEALDDVQSILMEQKEITASAENCGGRRGGGAADYVWLALPR